MPSLVESPGVRSTISQDGYGYGYDDGENQEYDDGEYEYGYDDGENGENQEDDDDEYTPDDGRYGPDDGRYDAGTSSPAAGTATGSIQTLDIEIVHPPQKGIAAWLAHLRRKNERRGALEALREMLF
jgi:hypothetical protein